MQDQLAIAGKGAGARRGRQEPAAAAASDAPSPQQLADAVLGLKAQADKLAGVGGYAAPKGPGAGEGGAFVLNITFSTGQVERIAMGAADRGPVLDGEVEPEDDAANGLPEPQPADFARHERSEARFAAVLAPREGTGKA